VPGNTKINISNGYHYLPAVAITPDYGVTPGYKIETYLDNIRIGYLVFLTLLLFAVAFVTRSAIAQILANLPLLLVTAYVFLNKKNILYLKPLDYKPQTCRG
jgi:hypothetical protein